MHAARRAVAERPPRELAPDFLGTAVPEQRLPLLSTGNGNLNISALMYNTPHSRTQMAGKQQECREGVQKATSPEMARAPHRLLFNPYACQTWLYAIGHGVVVEDLETGCTYVYIGMSKNLQRRFSEHSINTEPKSDLKSYLRRNLQTAKCWYTTDVDVKSLSTLEKRLVRH